MALAIELHEVYATAYDEIDFEPALNILTALRGRYRLGLVTNQTADAQFRKIKRLDPNGALFEVIMTSEQAGVEKPHPKIFSDALAQLKMTAASALMIGDNWEIDVEGASGFGIPALHLDPAHTGVPPALVSQMPFVGRVSELEDLLELL
ncbi:MAG: HAD-IA family hydrolase [Proteobacteria bacterium]|nr:HAD-IA family hydrolase [Pseudomonadota bacterium]